MIQFRHWFQSIFTKLFIAFFIIIIPLEATQSAMFKWSQNAVTEELNSAAAANVIYLRDNFVANIQALNTQLEYLLTDYTITSFFVNQKTLPVWDYYSTADQINKLLYLLKNSNPLLEEIVLYYPTLGLSLSSDRKIAQIDSAAFRQTIIDFRNQQALLMESEGSLIVGHMYPTTAYFSDSLPEFFVQAFLSDEAIRKHLSSFSQYSNKNAFMLNHNTDGIIASAEGLFGNAAPVEELTASILPRPDDGVYSSSVTISRESFICVACYSKTVNCSFVQLIPAQKLQGIPNRLRLFIELFSILAFMVIGIYSLITYRLVKQPMNDLTRAFVIAGGGNFDHHLQINYSSIEYNHLAEHFNKMTERIKSLIQSNYEQTIRLQHAELKQLQTQINPHFLYNSFFMLRHMIGQQNDGQAKSFVTYLGRYFQYITKNGHDLMPLQLEYDHAINYLTIQMLRFEDRLNASIAKLPGNYSQILVPRLILQPVLENILEHGIKNAEYQGLIRLSFTEECSRRLHIVIEDNGDQLADETLTGMQQSLLSDAPITETTGLINIHKRIQLHFGMDFGLSVARSELGGLAVNIAIPISPSASESPSSVCEG